MTLLLILLSVIAFVWVMLAIVCACVLAGTCDDEQERQRGKTN